MHRYRDLDSSQLAWCGSLCWCTWWFGVFPQRQLQTHTPKCVSRTECDSFRIEFISFDRKYFSALNLESISSSGHVAWLKLLVALICWICFNCRVTVRCGAFCHDMALWILAFLRIHGLACSHAFVFFRRLMQIVISKHITKRVYGSSKCNKITFNWTNKINWIKLFGWTMVRFAHFCKHSTLMKLASSSRERYCFCNGTPHLISIDWKNRKFQSANVRVVIQWCGRHHVFDRLF